MGYVCLAAKLCGVLIREPKHPERQHLGLLKLLIFRAFHHRWRDQRPFSNHTYAGNGPFYYHTGKALQMFMVLSTIWCEREITAFSSVEGTVPPKGVVFRDNTG